MVKRYNLPAPWDVRQLMQLSSLIALPGGKVLKPVCMSARRKAFGQT